MAGARAGLLIGTALKFGDPRRLALQQREFSAGTAENELLWSSVHPDPDRWTFEGADRVVAFADEHDLDLTATHFLWDPPALPAVLPDWVRAIDEPVALRAAMREHLGALHDRYGGRIDRWNVVNEALDVVGGLEPTNHFNRVLGPGYIAEAFEMAEEIWPEAQLVLNQHLVENIPATADALVALVRDLLADGVRIDRVGLQGHLFLGRPNWDLLESTMRRITALGPTVDLTEIDVPLRSIAGGAPIDLDQQASRGARIVRTCLAVEKCASITFWGFDDGDTWLDDFIGPGTQPLLWDADLRPKPMHDAVLEALLRGRPG
ncbi:MAG: endo-1,4-beta-xylanase [Acidimicrobiales bacterium]